MQIISRKNLRAAFDRFSASIFVFSTRLAVPRTRPWTRPLINLPEKNGGFIDSHEVVCLRLDDTRTINIRILLYRLDNSPSLKIHTADKFVFEGNTEKLR